MRFIFAALVIATLASNPVHAVGDLTALAVVQDSCAQVGDISFGANRRWADCRVTRGRWVSTIGLIDMYQAQYCLGNGEEPCAQRALMLFGNRAYTPVARLLLQRIDPGASQYDDPVVLKNDYGHILTVSAHLPDGASSKAYYLWHEGQWLPLDTQSWQRDLAKRLPRGVAARKVGLPDLDTMSLQVDLYRQGDADCCATAGVATVDLGLTLTRFALKKIAISPSPR